MDIFQERLEIGIFLDICGGGSNEPIDAGIHWNGQTAFVNWSGETDNIIWE